MVAGWPCAKALYIGGQIVQLGSIDNGEFLKLVDGQIVGAIPDAPGEPGDSAWGGVTGELADQEDLQAALDEKANTSSLSIVATSGAYNDLSGKPALFSGAYADLTGKPTLGTAAATAATAYATSAQGTKADSALQPAGNGSALTGLTKSQVGLANVDNTSDTSKPVSSATQTALDAKAPTSRAIVNGYGVSGGGNLSADRTLAVGLTSASAFATAGTTISAATYADITGASVSLAAGTWLIIGQVNIGLANAIIQAFVAITHNDNTVISEVAASRPASGTASLISPFTATVFAIVSPGSTTTYKLRGARGLTTHTGSWTAMDGNGVNTTNHATNNSDKGTGIFAVRIA